MAIPLTGAFSIEDISQEAREELLSPPSLNTLGGIVTPDLSGTNVSMSEFRGFSSITQSFGSITYTSATPNNFDAYRTLLKSGHSFNQYPKIQLFTDCSAIDGDSEWYWYYSLDSTSSWTLIDGGGSTSSIKTSYTSALEYYTVIRIRSRQSIYGDFVESTCSAGVNWQASPGYSFKVFETPSWFVYN